MPANPQQGFLIPIDVGSFEGQGFTMRDADAGGGLRPEQHRIFPRGDGIAAAAVRSIARSIPHFQQELGEPATQRREPRMPEHPKMTASPG